MRSPFNWAGDQLRKKAYKSRERNNIFGGFKFSFVHIYGVTKGLKGVKTNTDR